MRLGASVGRADPATIRQRARQLEDAGIDVLWAAELYGFDAASLMGFLAAATERAQIGSSILPFYSRSPALLAMTAAGVDALSGGRCILGIRTPGHRGLSRGPVRRPGRQGRGGHQHLQDHLAP